MKLWTVLGFIVCVVGLSAYLAFQSSCAANVDAASSTSRDLLEEPTRNTVCKLIRTVL